MNIAINGFGRIGRTTLRAIIQAKLQKQIQKALTSDFLKKNSNKIDKILINSLDNPEMIEYLVRHDTNYGTLNVPAKIHESKDSVTLKIDNIDIEIVNNRNPEKLPWQQEQVDVVLECTGAFTDYQGAKKHLDAGAKKVIISAPSKSPEVPTILCGINEDLAKDSRIMSMGSCTTNCAAIVMKIINNSLGVEKAFLNTTHAYTSTQPLVDNNMKDKKRRSRAAAANFLPTTTGAAISVTKAIPELEGKFDGMAVRIPISIVSLSDIVAVTKKDTTIEEINNIFRKEKNSDKYQGILNTSKEELASSDYIGDPFSCVIDEKSTNVTSKNLIRIVSWYDNEWAYVNRLVELAAKAI